MNKELKLLYIEDETEPRESLIALFEGDTIGGFTIRINAVDTFDNAIEEIESNNYHIIILDIYKGKPEENDEQTGLEILKQIQNRCFIPVIFYSGNTKDVRDFKSQIVGVVTKGDEGIEGLKSEIERLSKFNLPFVKEEIYLHLEKEFKTYFWDIIHKERDKFTTDTNDISLGYLMLRRFGNSLSKEKISEILGNNELKKDKIHPMEFYLYPTDSDKEYECGEILKNGEDCFVILTPSCDFIDKGTQKRKVGKVLLAKTSLLKDNDVYKKFKINNNKDSLVSLIESRKGDRYFFLPKTPFIENRLIDFQDKTIVNYEDLEVYERVVKLDSPFAESMIASFVRYHNRIGYPDIDSDLIIETL